MQIIVLLLNLHGLLPPLLLAVKVILLLTLHKLHYAIGKRKIRSTGNVQLAAAILPDGLGHLQNILVYHPAHLAENVERAEDVVKVSLVQAIILQLTAVGSHKHSLLAEETAAID